MKWTVHLKQIQQQMVKMSITALSWWTHIYSWCVQLTCILNYHNNDLYHGEVLQYIILKFLQDLQVFSFIGISVLMLFEPLQQNSKTLTDILKEDPDLSVFHSLVPHVTCQYFELVFLTTTKAKKWCNGLLATRLFFLYTFWF